MDGECSHPAPEPDAGRRALDGGPGAGDSWLSFSLLVVALVVAILTPVIGGSTLLGIASILSGVLMLGVAGVVARTIALQA